jgi:hypothetical protein
MTSHLVFMLRHPHALSCTFNVAVLHHHQRGARHGHIRQRAPTHDAHLAAHLARLYTSTDFAASLPSCAKYLLSSLSSHVEWSSRRPRFVELVAPVVGIRAGLSYTEKKVAQQRAVDAVVPRVRHARERTLSRMSRRRGRVARSRPRSDESGCGRRPCSMHWRVRHRAWHAPA